MIPEGVVDIDGILQSAAEARLSVFDRGLLYGDSAFEAMRTYGGVPFRGPEHLARLARSCSRLRIELELAQDELAARVTRAIARSGLPECYLRVLVTRGVAPLGLDLALAGRPSVLVYALALKLPDPAIYDGIAVGLVKTARATDGGAAAGAKASHYLAAMLALDEVKRLGCHEAIIVGARGELIEGTTSNLFVVDEHGLATPPPEAGILEGITRREVLDLAAELHIPCREQTLFPPDLKGAREAFITSSIREIVPVVRADDAVLGNGGPGPTTCALLAAYRARTRNAP